MQQIYVQQKQRGRKAKKNMAMAANMGAGPASKYAMARSKKGAVRSNMGNTAESMDQNPLSRLMQAPHQQTSK